MNPSALVRISDALLNTPLYKNDMLLEMRRVPSAQNLVQKLATVSPDLFRLVVHASTDERHKPMRVRVLEYDSNGCDTGRRHDLGRVRYEAD